MVDLIFRSSFLNDMGDRSKSKFLAYNSNLTSKKYVSFSFIYFATENDYVNNLISFGFRDFSFYVYSLGMIYILCAWHI